MRKFSCQLSVFSCQKKSIILLTTYYLLLTTLLCGCAKREIKNIDSTGKNIICFGDSITFGYGAEAGQDYPNQLSLMLDIPVINAGIDGDTSVEALKRLKYDVLDRDPLLVIIEFGGNDFLRRIPLGETLKNIEEMIKKMQSVNAMVAIADVSVDIIMGSYRKEFRRLSKIYGVIFIPQLYRNILTNPSLKSDNIHPNAAGYNIIAQRIYRTILPYLNQNIILKKFGRKT